MKKLVISFSIVLVAAAGAALVLVHQKPVREVRPTELVPANTLFYAELPNWPRSQERWKQTDIYQLWHEPEVQAFLEKPKSKIPWLADWQAKADQFAAVQPQRAFAALTTLEGDSPQFVAGFSFGGNRADVEKALAEPRAQLHRAWPTGKADLQTYRDVEIQLYGDKDNTVAEAFRENWYFISNKVDLLKATIDRYDGTPGADKALGEDPVFQKTLAALPSDSDVLAYGRFSALIERLRSLMLAAGQPIDPAQDAVLKKMQAIAVAAKMDGAQFRDSMFTYAPGMPEEKALARSGLELSTPGTLFYLGMRMPAASAEAQANMLTTLIKQAPFYPDLEKALAEKDLKLSDIGEAFGPEFTLLGDWGETAMTPTAEIGLDVRQAEKAKGLLDIAAAMIGSGGAAWTKTEKDGVTTYAPPPNAGLPMLQPAIGISDKFVIAGLSPKSVIDALAQAKQQGGKLTDQAGFKTAEKTVLPPTNAFGYFDVRALIERSSAIFRPLLAMSLAMNPDSGQYIDAGKLPATATLTKHLGPTVYSSRTTDQGALTESAGPITFNQAIFVAAVGVGAAAVPAMEQAMKGGGPPNLLPPGLIPGFPGAPVPPPPPSAPLQGAPPPAGNP